MMRSPALTLTALLLVACTIEKNDTGSGTGDDSTTGAPTTEGNSESSTGGEPGPTSTAGSPMTTPVTSGDSESTTSGESSTSGGEPAGTCDRFCATWNECLGGAPGDLEECLLDCQGALQEFEEPCLGAMVATMECQSTLTCVQLDAMEQGDDGPCLDEAMAQQEVCGFGNSCSFGGGGDPEGMECSFMRECAGEPKLEMKCTAMACECFSDDMKFGECAPEDVCADFELLSDKALSCCGIEGDGG